MDEPLIGHRITRHGAVGSTNDLAWDLAPDPQHHGRVILAEEQTAGRGRRGCPWRSPPGGSLLLSVVLHPPRFLCRPVVLTLWAALGLCRAVHEVFQLKPMLKWPNDVLLEGKKIAGVLVEQRQNRCVAGVGLNLSAPIMFFTDHHLPHAAAVSHFAHQPVDREHVLQELLQCWNASYQTALAGDFTPLEQDWHNYTRWIGRDVLIESSGNEYQGTLQRMNVDAITLRQGREERKFAPETIRRLTPAVC
jgi:BirA family transcriptional regulator, biotin operon repressor / biotin---[acetyl-CoA-carboxylase] ligase